RLAVATGPARRDAVPVPALGRRAPRARRVGAAARPDGRDARRGALPEPRRRSRLRGRGRGARAGRRARRRRRDPLAPALAPPAALERLRPPLRAAARLDRRAGRPSGLWRRDARPLGAPPGLALGRLAGASERRERGADAEQEPELLLVLGG